MKNFMKKIKTYPVALLSSYCGLYFYSYIFQHPIAPLIIWPVSLFSNTNNYGETDQ